MHSAQKLWILDADSLHCACLGRGEWKQGQGPGQGQGSFSLVEFLPHAARLLEAQAQGLGNLGGILKEIQGNLRGVAPNIPL